MASGHTVILDPPTASMDTTVCPDGPSGRTNSGAGAGWNVVALSPRRDPTSSRGVRVTVGE
eukprot:5786719-Alexandrium_andersonii.AAC.1